MVVRLSAHIVRYKSYSEHQMDTFTSPPSYTDTSGLQGWDAHWDGRWLQSHWSPLQSNMDITWKELFAIVVAVHMGLCLALAKFSSIVITTLWSTWGSTYAPHTMTLVRLLYFCTWNYHINVWVIRKPWCLQ